MHAKRPQDFTIANPERQFFLLTGVWFLALTVLGFSRSFFFRADYHGPLETPYLLHGFAFTSWLVIYLVQVGLITAGRIKWHMILGKLGAIVLIGVLVTGFYVVLLDTSGGGKSLLNAGANITSIFLAVLLATVAIVYRYKSSIHKRLMLTATLFIMGAPIQRSMAFWQLERDRVFETALTMLPLVALVFFDLLYYKKFKPLSLILAIGVFSFMWFRLYRPIFNSSWGEPIISGLTKVFLLS